MNVVGQPNRREHSQERGEVKHSANCRTIKAVRPFQCRLTQEGCSDIPGLSSRRSGGAARPNNNGAESAFLSLL